LQATIFNSKYLFVFNEYKIYCNNVKVNRPAAAVKSIRQIRAKEHEYNIISQDVAASLLSLVLMKMEMQDLSKML
jgi:hypothetical protein